MLDTAAILFAVAAAGGLAMAIIHLRSQGATHPPMPLALLHGVLAAAALLLVVVAFAQAGASNLGWLALALFVIATLGGFVLFANHLRKKALPTPLVLVHGGAAAVGFVLLLAVIL